MSKVKSLATLATEKMWVAWQQEVRDGKPTKVPKNPVGGNAKVPTDPTTYGTRAAAEKRWQTIKKKIATGGIGVVLCELPNGQHLVGIDLDSCQDESGVIADWAEEVIERFDTYAEISPSGTGVKLFFLMNAEGFAKLCALLGCNADGKQLTRKTFAIGEHREVAIDTARFYAVTDQRLKDSPKNLRSVAFDDVAWFIEEVGPNYKQRGGNGHANSFEDQHGERDESGSGFGFRFMRDECHPKKMSYEEAREAILADENEAGEWANRAGERQLKRAWENSKSSPVERLGIEAPPLKTKLMQTSAEFVAGFVPPDYLIDGLLQRRYVYSFTAPTGAGKTSIALRIAAHVAMGKALAGREVEKGRVLFFAGENPDDVRARWIKLCEQFSVPGHPLVEELDVVFMPFTVNLSEKKIRERIDAEAAEHGPFSLLIVDTSASYYSGDDENDNVALGNHARMLRTFVELPGGPTVLVTCHPTKTPNMDNLLPRGGGAFLAEVDGNLVCIKDAATMTVEVTTHGKFRGPDFAPFSFSLVAGQSEKLVDTKGRAIWSIFARPISNEDVEAIKQGGRSDQDDVLRAMLDHPGLSLLELAEHLHWRTVQGEPSKQKVHRVMAKLKQAKLVEQTRDDRYVLTKKGTEEAEKTPEDLVKVEPK